MAKERAWDLLDKAAIKRDRRSYAVELYEAAKKATKTSLCYSAAKAIAERRRERRRVAIATGFNLLVGDRVRCETDGPVGAVALAYVLSIDGWEVALAADEYSSSVLEALVAAAGLSADVYAFPLEYEEAEEAAKSFLKLVKPSVIVAVERPGWNAKGVHHDMRGRSVSGFNAPLDLLFLKARESGITTIGIGDGGNEIGMGAIREFVAEVVPYGRICSCPCRGGIASAVETDFLVVGSVSNWAAYALAGAYCLLRKTDYPYTAELDAKLLRAAVRSGAVDGLLKRESLSVDGASVEECKGVVARVAKIVNSNTVISHR
mgnify:CR=1 FL=1